MWYIIQYMVYYSNQLLETYLMSSLLGIYPPFLRHDSYHVEDILDVV
jgi:hypothetical protein